MAQRSDYYPQPLTSTVNPHILNEGFRNAFDYLYQLRKDLDAANTSLASTISLVTEISSRPTPSAHILLDASQDSDTVKHPVVAGDLIYGNTTPKWDALAAGTDGYVLTMVSGGPAWEPAPTTPVVPHILLDGDVDSDTVNHPVVKGDIIVGNATPRWDALAVGADGKFLTVSSGEPAWGDIPTTTHILLDGSIDSDTVNHAVVAGDLIYGDATPKWNARAKGTDGDVLSMVSGYPDWTTITNIGLTETVLASDDFESWTTGQPPQSPPYNLVSSYNAETMTFAGYAYPGNTAGIISTTSPYEGSKCFQVYGPSSGSLNNRYTGMDTVYALSGYDYLETTLYVRGDTTTTDYTDATKQTLFFQHWRWSVQAATGLGGLVRTSVSGEPLHLWFIGNEGADSGQSGGGTNYIAFVDIADTDWHRFTMRFYTDRIEAYWDGILKCTYTLGSGTVVAASHTRYNHRVQNMAVYVDDYSLSGWAEGAGDGWYKGLNGNDQEFKSPFAGQGIILTVGDRIIEIAVDTDAIQIAGNYLTGLTGDVTATGPGTVAATLATVNSNVGSFTFASITVNAKGLVTAASSGTSPLTSTGWTDTAGIVHLTTATDKVVIGANTGPTNTDPKFQVNSGLKASAAAPGTDVIQLTTNEAAALVAAFGLSTSATAGSRFGFIDISEATVGPRTLSLQQSGGNVVIGGTSTTARLDVVGGYLRAFDDGTNNFPSTGSGLECAAVGGTCYITGFNRGTSAYLPVHINTSALTLNDAGGPVIVGGGAAASELRLLEPSGSGTNYTGWKAQAMAADLMYVMPAAQGAASTFLQNNGSGTLIWAAGNSGTVTTVSVVSANGFAGTVANATSTPAITLTTTITGILKGNGTAISAATAGTDYAAVGAIGSSGLTMNTARLLGRTTAAAGSVEEITVGSGLTLSAGTLTGNLGTVTAVTASSPLSSSGGTTPNITIADAAADGATKGAATFTAADFNSSTGLISIDYTNGQAASASAKGFLTSTDWSTFNAKQAAGNYITALTGDVTASGPGSVATTIVAQNSAFWAGKVTDETGTGKWVFSDSPAFTTLITSPVFANATPPASADIVYINRPTTGVGTITVSAAGTTVTGVGTFFALTCSVGDTITANSETHTIASIASNTSMVTDAWTSAASGVAFTLAAKDLWRFFPNGSIFFGGSALNANGNAFRFIQMAPTITFPSNSTASTFTGVTLQPTATNSSSGIFSVTGMTFTNILNQTTNTPSEVRVAGVVGSIQIGGTNTKDWPNVDVNAPTGFRAFVQANASSAGTIASVSAYNAFISPQTGATVTISKAFGYKLHTISTITGLTHTYSVGMGLFNVGSVAAGGTSTNNSYIVMSNTLNQVPTGNFAIYDDTGYATYLSSNLRLVYTVGSVYTDFTVDSSGNLAIAPTGTKITLSSAIDTSGKITKYNAISTVSNGVPSEYATIDSTGLTANVGATTLYAVPAAAGGMYRISCLVVETTAGSLSSTLPNVQIVYVDNETGGTITIDATPILGIAGIGQTGALTANTIGTTATGVIVINAKASNNIQYQTVNYASNLAGMAYALHIKCEAM